MSNAIYGFHRCCCGTVSQPTTRGRFVSNYMVSMALQSLPDDPIGTHTLTLTNVVVGSRISIRDQDGTVAKYDQIAATSTVVITLNVYGVASLNNWRIRIRKASAAPKYLPYETLMTATPGSSSIYVSQLPDPIAS